MNSLFRDGFKLLVPHREGCWYDDEESAHHDRPFVLHDGIEWRRRRNGAEGGSTAFHRFLCNDADCPAIMLVRIDVLSDWIGRG